LGWSGSPKRSALSAAIGPRAHGEHVAQDAADAGCRALVGLDEARVVVAFHLEHDGLVVAKVDHAGVLAGALDDLVAGRRQRLEPLLR
jgi:predicted dienelactone hydrolase